MHVDPFAGFSGIGKEPDPVPEIKMSCDSNFSVELRNEPTTFLRQPACKEPANTVVNQ